MLLGFDVPLPHSERVWESPLSKSSENTQLLPSSVQRRSTAATGRSAERQSKMPRPTAPHATDVRTIAMPPHAPISMELLGGSSANGPEPDVTAIAFCASPAPGRSTELEA